MILKNFELYGIDSIIKTEEYPNGAMCRVPDSVRKELNFHAQGTAFQTCGVELRFKMVSDKISVTFTNADQNEPGIFEVYFGSMRIGRNYFSPTGKGEKVTIDIEKRDNYDERLVENYAKLNLPFELDYVRILMPSGRYELPLIEGEVELATGTKLQEKTYLAYGSSITNGSSAASPSNTYARLVANQLNCQLINFGFPGTCHADKCMADHIATATKADYISMELGVNMIWDVDKGVWGDIEQFKTNINYFVPTIVNANPQAKIVITNIFRCINNLKKDAEIIPFEQAVRDIAAKVMKEHKNVKFVEGLDLLKSYDGLSADFIHPVDKGMKEIADNFVDAFINW